jgi:hypothetical protein
MHSLLGRDWQLVWSFSSMSLEGRLSGGSTILAGGLRSRMLRAIEMPHETYET